MVFFFFLLWIKFHLLSVSFISQLRSPGRLECRKSSNNLGILTVWLVWCVSLDLLLDFLRGVQRVLIGHEDGFGEKQPHPARGSRWKWRGTKKPLDESESGEWKSWLKAQHSENKDHGIWSHHFMANRWGNSVRLYFFGLQNHCRWWLQPWN